MVERKTVKPTEVVYNYMNDVRTRRRHSWDEFFTKATDAYVELEGVDESEPTGDESEIADKDRIREFVREELISSNSESSSNVDVGEDRIREIAREEIRDLVVDQAIM